MTEPKTKFRLYIPTSYHEGGRLVLSGAQAHYAAHVMRARPGECVSVFNGADGEWLAEIAAVNKKSVELVLREQLARQRQSPDLWLAFAPIKHATDLVVEKAVELGVSKLCTVITRRGVVKSIHADKLMSHAIEAAEQCERHDLPALEHFESLEKLLGSWPKDRTLLFGDESGGGEHLGRLLEQAPAGKYGVLIGPEGGFAPEELAMLRAQPFAKGFGLGPRILRADTASVAALSCVQARLGDWDHKPHFKAVTA